MRHLTRILPISLLCLGLPATATARLRTVAPPGDSGISQYAEVVPTAAGATPPRGGGGALGGQGGALTAIQRGDLNALGPDGRTLAAVVDATAPQALGVPVASRAETRSATGVGRAGGSGGESEGSSGSPDASSLPSSPTSSPVSIVLGAAAGQGSGGLGIWLPGFMLVSALGVGVLAVRRRRAAS
jgi:hypothetical protein